MKKVPFTVEFVTKFDTDEFDRVPVDTLAQMCKEGLLELIAPRMAEINNGATKITVEVVA